MSAMKKKWIDLEQAKAEAQFPPEWAIRAARKLFHYNAAKDQFWIGEVARIIAAHAPKLDEAADDLMCYGDHRIKCPCSRFEAADPTRGERGQFKYGGVWMDVEPKCDCGFNEAIARLRAVNR